MSDLSNLTDEQLSNLRHDTELAKLQALIQTGTTDELIQLMELIEADKRRDIEARYAAVAAKFEAEEGRKG
jgi:hypothetical protein